MFPTRNNRIIQWLSDIENNVNVLYNIFYYNLISPKDIGEKNHQLIMKQFNDLNITLNDTLFEVENNY